jgi:hypothetical protein
MLPLNNIAIRCYGIVSAEGFAASLKSIKNNISEDQSFIVAFNDHVLNLISAIIFGSEFTYKSTFKISFKYCKFNNFNLFYKYLLILYNYY